MLPVVSGSALQVAITVVLKFGRQAFSVAGPTVWNSLTDYLRDQSLSEDTFRPSLNSVVK